MKTFLRGIMNRKLLLYCIFLAVTTPVCNKSPSGPAATPPYAPTAIAPATGATNQNVPLVLSWAGGGPEASDTVRYDVYLGTDSASLTKISGRQLATTFADSTLSYSATYYWRVIASTGKDSTIGALWHFSTAVSYPPTVPVYSTPANGATNQGISLLPFTWSASDSGPGDTLRYDLYLGTSNPPRTMVGVSLTGTTFSKSLAVNTTYYWYVVASNGRLSTAGPVWQFTTQPTNPGPTVMRQIPGGTFWMGDTDYILSDEKPLHQVTISPFFMDSTDVTQADYLAMMGNNPSYYNTGDTAPIKPVEQLTWFDAVLYCNARSRHEGLDTVYSYDSVTANIGDGTTNLADIAADFSKNGYRLPTEAEWEYACRAGSTTQFYWGAQYPPKTSGDTLELDSNAIWIGNSPGGTQPANAKKPNAWGLYGMSGNVWQYCNDWYGSDYYSESGGATDPAGPTTGLSRILRCGSFGNTIDCMRSGERGMRPPNSRFGGSAGFRCVRR